MGIVFSPESLIIIDVLEELSILATCISKNK